MDKYEYRIKAEQIRKLAEQEDYASAMKIANTIDWNRVRSIPMLCLVGEIYERNNMLEESRDVMLIAYDRHPYGRMIIYSLAELSIRLEDYIDAVEYYKEFVQVAPRDTGRYILQYKLYEAQDVGVKERIAVLEEFKRHEYVEKWAFELAYLYHRAGMGEQCVAECDEIILWFSEGKYVEKAMELKMLYQPLTEEQQKKYDSRNDVQIEKSIAAVEAVAERAKEEEPDINVKPLNYGIYDTVNLQKELAKSMQQILAATEKETVDSTLDNIKKLVKESNIEGLVEEEEEAGNQTKEIIVPEEAVEEVSTEEPVLEDSDVMAEAAKLMGQLTSVSKRSSIDEQEAEDNDEIEEEIEENPEKISSIETPEETEEDLEKTKEFILHIADAPTKIIPVKNIKKELKKESDEKTEDNQGKGNALIKYDDMLSEELDGQISICVPDEDIVEKQITGQMSIEEVLTEWERIKSEVEEEKYKSLEEARAKAIAETEDIMDRLADVVPVISDRMQKMMEDREEEAEFENTQSGEPVLQSILEEENVFEDLEEAIEKEAAAVLKVMSDSKAADGKGIAKENAERDLEEIAEEDAERDLEEIAEEDAERDLEEIAEESAERDLEEIAEESAESDLEKILEEEFDREDNLDDVEEAILRNFENQGSLDELDEFGKEEEPEDEDAAEELESRLSARLPEGIDGIAGKEEEEEPQPLEADAEAFKRIFKYFTEIEGVSDQIVDALESIEEISDKGNIVIMGDSATGKTTLAVDIIKAARRSRNITGNKIARITGEAVNNKDLETIIKSAAGGVLIIETAASMNADTVGRFSEVLDNTEANLLVIIEDTKERMLKLLEMSESFRNKFPARIDLPPYTNTDLVAFAKSYALEKGCKIDEMGVLALYSRLAELQFETEFIPSLADVKEMIDGAIEHAGKKSLKNVIGTFLSKRYDSEHYLILKEKDFIV